MAHHSASTANLSKDHRSPRGLARLLGDDHTAAMMVSKIAAWSKVAKKKEFGVTKTDEEWCRDLEVTRKQLRRIKKLIVDFGLIEKTRTSWGKRPNALFLKPTLFGKRILETLPLWAPPSSPMGPIKLGPNGPNGQVEYALHSPNGPFLYPIETPTKKNKTKEITEHGDHAKAWSLFRPEDFYKLVDQEDVTESRPIEIDTVPRLVAFWDMIYCLTRETEISPPWLPGHLGVIDSLIDKTYEEFVTATMDADQKEPEEDVAEYLKSANAEMRTDSEAEVCRNFALIIWGALPLWDEFTDWLTEKVGTRDVPATPEVEFLIYFSELAKRWVMECRADDDVWNDALHLMGDRLDKMETELHEVAAKHNPGYLPAPLTDDQRISILKDTGISPSLAIMAARHWNKWQEFQEGTGSPKPFSVDAMIADLPKICDWAHGLWNPEGKYEIEGSDEECAVLLPTPSKENDYWPDVSSDETVEFWKGHGLQNFGQSEQPKIDCAEVSLGPPGPDNGG